MIREASREKVLEMYGTAKIEAIPLSNQAEGRDQVPNQNGTEPRLPTNSEPSSGRLFLPPALKRSERHSNPAVSLMSNFLFFQHLFIIMVFCT